MRTAPGALVTLLNSGVPLFPADLFTITTVDGTIYRWTSCDVDLTVSSLLFTRAGSANVPTIKRGHTKLSSALDVDTLDITLGVGSEVTLGGIPMQSAAANGAFDWARVKLERTFMTAPPDTSAGSLVLFEGLVSGVDPTSTEIVLRVVSELDRLNVPMPRNLYMPSCGHVLYDAGCGIVKATFTVAGTASGTPTTVVIPTSRTEADGYFNLGVIAFTNGPAAGSRRGVKSYVNASGTFTVSLPFPAAPVAGNTFNAYPGCDKSQATCSTKYSNLTRFRGFPYVPRPEQAH